MIQFSRILLESSSPTWNSSDLRFSRLKDYDLGLILLFKVGISSIKMVLIINLLTLIAFIGTAVANPETGSSFYYHRPLSTTFETDNQSIPMPHYN